MSIHDNNYNSNGGRIAYASKSAAQLLGFGGNDNNSKTVPVTPNISNIPNIPNISNTPNININNQSLRFSSPVRTIPNEIGIRNSIRPHSFSPNKSRLMIDDDHTSNIRVVVRIRPLNEQEKRAKRLYCVGVRKDENPNSLIIQKLNKKNGSLKKEKQFTFDKVCDIDTSQPMFFDSCGVKQLVNASLNGYATTIFAYGQTGSGKTYSICGDDTRNISNLSGIIPRTIMYLWNNITSNMNNTQNTSYIIRAGYLEIYNERPRDLLNPCFNNLSVRWNSENGFFVENQCIVRCESAQDLFAVFNEGEVNRKRGSHELNTNSSRSHCLFTIHIEIKQEFIDYNNIHHNNIQNGKISIVDLAGSEKLKDSKQSSDKGLRETANINRSLFTLGKVISILEKVQNKQLSSSTYIPYRDSVLTKLLMDSLGGNGMAIMIACISPSNAHIDETLSTLYYASRARNIKNIPSKKIHPKDRIIAQLIQEIQRLKSENLKMKQYISQNQISPNQIAQSQMSQNQMSPNQMSLNQISPNQISPQFISQHQLSQNQLSQNQILMDKIEHLERVFVDN